MTYLHTYTHSFATQEGDQIHSTAQEGHYSNQNSLNIDTGSVFTLGQNIILH